MSKKGKYKGLPLDRDSLPGWIQEFVDNKFKKNEVSEIVQHKDTHHKCIINGDDIEIILDLYFSNDGKTTISPSAGKHQDIKVELADFIVGKLKFKNSDVKNRSYSIENLERDVFDELIDYLKQMDGVNLAKHKRSDVNTSDLWQFTSKIGDKITLIYYDKKKLQIQGKPLYLYNEVSVFLSAFVEFDEVIKNRQEFFDVEDVEINPIKVKEEMQDSLPSAYNILGDNLKKILAGSFALQKFDYPFEDYSPIAFPALKALEGYLKQILLPYNIIVGKTFATVFQLDGTKHVLIQKHKGKIGNNVVIQSAEQIYAYLFKNRHTLFHTGSVDADTRIVETKQEADMIVADVLSLIETTHSDIQASSR